MGIIVVWRVSSRDHMRHLILTISLPVLWGAHLNSRIHLCRRELQPGSFQFNRVWVETMLDHGHLKILILEIPSLSWIYYNMMRRKP